MGAALPDSADERGTLPQSLPRPGISSDISRFSAIEPIHFENIDALMIARCCDDACQCEERVFHEDG